MKLVLELGNDVDSAALLHCASELETMARCHEQAARQELDGERRDVLMAFARLCRSGVGVLNEMARVMDGPV